MQKDNIKVFVKYEKRPETLVQTRRIYNLYIRTKFGTEKCAMIFMKREKRETAECMKHPNQKRTGKLGVLVIYKYLEILEEEIVNQAAMKEKWEKCPQEDGEDFQN